MAADGNTRRDYVKAAITLIAGFIVGFGLVMVLGHYFPRSANVVGIMGFGLCFVVVGLAVRKAHAKRVKTKLT